MKQLIDLESCKAGLFFGHSKKNSRRKKLKTQRKNKNSSSKLNFSAFFEKITFSENLFLPILNIRCVMVWLKFT